MKKVAYLNAHIVLEIWLVRLQNIRLFSGCFLRNIRWDSENLVASFPPPYWICDIYKCLFFKRRQMLNLHSFNLNLFSVSRQITNSDIYSVNTSIKEKKPWGKSPTWKATSCCRKRALKTSNVISGPDHVIPRRLRFDVYSRKPEAKCFYSVHEPWALIVFSLPYLVSVFNYRPGLLWPKPLSAWRYMPAETWLPRMHLQGRIQRKSVWKWEISHPNV